MSDSGSALDAIARSIVEAEDADDGLRAAVETLVSGGLCGWASILFVEAGELVLGPQAGTPQPDTRARVPVAYHGTQVAELVADGCGDVVLLQRLADLLSPYCLVGWDTGGIPWDPAA